MKRQAKLLPRGTGGFTLIELMVAMAIGLFLLIGLISLLVTTSHSRTELDKTGRQIENGRFALSLLVDDVAHAGYLGNYDPKTVTSIVGSPCAPSTTDFDPASTPNPTVPLFLYGYDGSAADAAMATALSCLTQRQSGTGVLVVRRLSTNAIAVSAATDGETYMQVAACVPIATGKSFVVSNAKANFTLENKNCGGNLASVNKYMVHVYYVSTCNDCTVPDNVPTLKMAEWVYQGGAMTMSITPLAEGIQDLQVDYGVDVDNDGSPDCYVGYPSTTTAPAVGTLCQNPTAGGYSWATALTNWQNVTTARIYVLARTIDPSAGWTDTRTYDLGKAGTYTPSAGDHYKRHVYSALARVTNIAGRRDVP